MHAAIIVTGGAIPGPAGTSVELLHSDGSPWCSLPNLPEHGRYYHTQTGLEACGGYGPAAPTTTTCVRLEAGSWSPSYPYTSHELVERRANHCSWASPAGTLLIGGGYDDSGMKTTELLDANSGDSVTSFPLKYDTR